MEFALSSSMAALQLYPKYLHIPANAWNDRRAYLLAWSAFIHTVRQSKSIRSYFKSGTGLPAARVADRFLAEAA